MPDARRRALLVASTRYEDPKLRDLRSPEADVEQLTKVLGDPRIGNFELEPPLIDGAKGDVEGEIEGFFEGAGPRDLLLLYLSGHGVVSKNRQWFFATPNTKVGRYGSTAVSDTYIRERMKGSRSDAIVLVLDCCHSGLFTRSLLAKGGDDIHVEHRFEGRGRVALTASTEIEVALEGEPGGDRERPLSVFTELLVEGLRTGDADLDGDGQISISELYNYVAGRMPTRSPGQTPGKAGDVFGEIVIAAGRRAPALPADVRHALLSSYPALRRTAVELLVQLRSGADPDVARAIDDALARLALDDEPEVAEAARAAQGAAPIAIDLTRLPRMTEDLLPPPPALRPGQAAWEEGRRLEREGDLTAAEGAYLRSVGQGNATAQSAVERVRRKRFDLERAVAVHGPRAGRDRTAAAKLARAYQVAGVPPPKRDGTTRTWGAAGRVHERLGDLAAAEEAYVNAVETGEVGAEGALARLRKKRSDLANAEETWGPRAARGDARADRKLAKAYEIAGVTRAGPG